MLGRYPDKVGRHKPCGPVVVMVPSPRLGLFFATTVVVLPLVGSVTQD